MRYFVTGGAGFIGSHFVRMLLNEETSNVEAVTVFDNFSYSGNELNLIEFADDRKFRLIRGDICDSTLVAQCLPGHDVIINFAAESHVDRSIQSSSPFIQTNIAGTHNLLEATRKSDIKTFVHISTDEVYGSIESGSWSESEPLLPNSPYAASKAGGDLIARSFFQTYGIDIRITRCSNNFGTHQFPEKLIPLFVTNLFDDLVVPLYGDGLNTRDWLHVHDHCRAIYLVATGGKPGEIYNVGGGTELTNLELTKKILALCGKDDSSVLPVQDRLGHDRRYSVDWSKIRSELGYIPQKTLESSLEEIIHWYRCNESWWRPLKKSI